ncbi:lamin tail domain-containing protein [Pontiellaceae bacterium B12227]|nr:lamin tail domain-containing protein [Pontiellaceae bacterium B12227]
MLRTWVALLLFAGWAGSSCAQEQVEDTRFSVDRGFYSSSTNLVISSQTPSATITYTLDGSDPRTSPTANSGTNPILVAIDPDSSTGKWKATPAVMVRAYAHSPGMLPTNVDTHTYIFPSKVKTQGDIRPEDGSFIFWNSTEMDPQVTTDPAYASELDEALLSLPSLSIVMDHEDLFGTEGIHRGDNLENDWEMPCSMELIYPDTPHFSTFQGFQIDCGIKNQGGGALWQNGLLDSKQSFGMRFRRKYGQGNLNYPFFEHAPLNPDSAAGEYDKLVLRAGFNKGYGHDYDLEHTVYARDQLARDLQIDMSGIGSHGSFVHLYLNGIYWGLYNPCERPDNAFAASYLGGNKEDYFCGKGKGGDTAGVDDRYDTWINTISKTADISTLREYCNIDNHADMTMFSIYAAIGDFPQYYYDVRNNPGGQVNFFNWDAEDAFGGGSKRTSDEPNISNGSKCYGFYDMVDYNIEYRMNFADRVYKACFNGGALSDEHVLENWNRLCDSIYSAMICESARWGDEKVSSPITRDDEWVSARDAVATGTVGKADWLVSIFRSDGILYPPLNPPLFNEGTDPINTVRKEIPVGFELTIERDGSSGTVYYTIDGSDPRLEGGAPQGMDAGTGTTITINSTTVVKARTKDGSTWSALHEIALFVEEDLSALKITEIMYNPEDAVMATGAAIASIKGNGGSIDPNYTNRALVEFSATLPEALTGGDKVTISGASNAANNGTFTISKVIFDGVIGETRTKKVLLNQTLLDENSGGLTADFLYDGDRYEFVEIKNTGATSLNLSGVTFTRGIKYTFPDGAALAPGSHAVLARNPWNFVERYTNVTPFGSFPASTLDNSSERLELAFGSDVRHEIYGTVTSADNFGVIITTDIPGNIGPGDRLVIKRSEHYVNNQMYKIQSILNNIVFVDKPLPTESEGAEAFFYKVISSVKYDDHEPWPLPPDGYGFSLVPTNSNPILNQDNPEVWRASANVNGSPGMDDPTPVTPTIKINEALTHTDAPLRDTVELYNPHNQAADIGGWFLTDNRDIPKKWMIPEGTIIPANGYKTFYEGHYTSSVLEFDNDEFGSAFSLSSTGDEIYLFSPTLGYSHGFGFEGSYNGISFGRHETSEGEEHFPSQQSFTPSAPNAGPAIGPVIITEIMYNPADGHHEYIELANVSDSTVQLFDPSNPTNTWKVGGISFQFPDTNVALAQGQIMLLVRDTITPAAFRTTYSISNEVQVFSYTGKLANDGETLTLRAPDEPVQTGSNAGEVAYIIIDQVAFADTAPWPTEADGQGRSLERISSEAYGNDVSNWAISSQNGGSPGLAPQLPEVPLIVDDDADGLDDNWEMTHFSSTNHAAGNPEDDFDQDGQTNLDEFISGTVPTDSNSRFAAALSTSKVEGNTHFTISWNAASNRVYDVLWAPRLGEGFQYLATGITHPQNSYTDTVHTAKSSCYYQILTRMPLPGDLDADGLPDDWENRYFSSTFAATAHLDTDGDRISNAGEYIAGTDPTDETSYPGLTSVKSSTNGYIVEWNSVTGRIYRIHYTETLGQPLLPISSWMPYPQDAYTDSVHAAQSSGYYDIRVELEK